MGQQLQLHNNVATTTGNIFCFIFFPASTYVFSKGEDLALSKENLTTSQVYHLQESTRVIYTHVGYYLLEMSKSKGILVYTILRTNKLNSIMICNTLIINLLSTI